MKKLISILLALSVLLVMISFSLTAVFADEKSLNLTYETWDGDDEHKQVEIPVEWNFNYFDRAQNDVDNYPVNYKMAIPAIILSKNAESGKAAIENNLPKLGFSNLFSANYEDEKDLNSPGYTFGYTKQMINDVECNVFAIVVRGTNTKSIADIITDIISVYNHFEPSADNIFDSFESYAEDVTGLEKEELCNQHNKFFITGHSLGGAVADRVSQLVTDYCDKTDIFSFPFATPRTRTDDYNINMPSGVTNICFIDDIVPNLIPPEISVDPFDDDIFTGKIINKYTYYDLFFGPELIDTQIFKSITGHDFNEFFVPEDMIANHSTDYYLAYCLTMDKYPNLNNKLDLSEYSSFIFTGLDNNIEIYDGEKWIGSYVDGQISTEKGNEDIFVVEHKQFISVFFSKKGNYKFIVTAKKNNITDMHMDVFSGMDMQSRHFTHLSLDKGEQFVLYSNDSLLTSDKLYKIEGGKEVAYLFGDSDGDGEITIADATVIQMTLAQINPKSFDKNKADSNHDKRNDIIDVSIIQQYLATMIEYI